MGLTSQRAGGRGAYDKFRSRSSSPSATRPGGGRGSAGASCPARPRPPDSNAPKYLNSPATPLFDKSRTLYLIERARGEMRKADQAVLVEGYTDALMAHQAGFENVVASPGHGAHARPGGAHRPLRPRDRPGLRRRPGRPARRLDRRGGAVPADRRCWRPRRRASRSRDVRVARLPEGKDPDEVIRDNPDLWREAIRTAQPIIEFLIDYYATAIRRAHAGGASATRWRR